VTNLLLAFQIFLAFLLALLILLQGRGTGLSSSFGGGGETFQTRRGFEKLLLYLTIFVLVLFSLTLLFSVFS